MKEAGNEAFALSIPDDWDDITEEFNEEEPGAPFTVAKLPNGKGALQVSSATYQAGTVPDIAHSVLEDMQREFASSRGLGPMLSHERTASTVLIDAASYRANGDFLRVWYVSDRVNVAFITYTCKWKYRRDEIADAERIVRSIRFKGGE